MSKPPDELFWLEITLAPGDSLKYRERGGGKFSSYDAAKARLHQVLNRHPSATGRILHTRADWKEVVS